MSRVRKGDFYRFLDMTKYGYKEGACFLCKEAPLVDYRYSSTTPTIHMGVAEIQQAAPTVDRTPRLESPPKLPALPSLDDLIADDGVVTETRVPRSGRFDADDSVEDVDFKE